jgi:hypothetical protein
VLSGGENVSMLEIRPELKRPVADKLRDLDEYDKSYLDRGQMIGYEL